MVESLSLMMWATGLMILWMSGLWIISLVKKEADIVDAGWAAGIGIVALYYAISVQGGYSCRNLLLSVVVLLWSARLTYYLVRTRVLVAGEDGRYVQLRSSWGEHANRNFLIFFNAQGLLVVVLSVVFLLSMRNPTTTFSFLEVLGFMLWTAAFIGEVVADSQLHQFRANPLNKGRTCDTGLWGYSRHPNYFCEWLMWLSYSLLALAAPWGWLGLASPLIMLYLILCITGIPPTEERAIASRGDEYRAYQRRVSPFIPWFPKRNS